MEIINSIILNYRESLRGIWNNHFYSWLDEDYAANTMKRFRELDITSLDDGVTFIRVAPKSEGGCRILVRRKSGDGYWDDPFNKLESNQCDLRFCRFFDWSELEYLNGEFCLVRIKEIPGQPQLTGREALISTSNVDFYLSNGLDLESLRVS
jgi:hypothetical protein